MRGKDRAYLRSLAHNVKALYQMGKDGIDDNFIAMINEALTAKELIKISLQQSCPIKAYDACDEICEKTGAEPIQVIGRKIVIYRANPDKPVIER